MLEYFKMYIILKEETPIGNTINDQGGGVSKKGNT